MKKKHPCISHKHNEINELECTIQGMGLGTMLLLKKLGKMVVTMEKGQFDQSMQSCSKQSNQKSSALLILERLVKL